MILRNEDVKPVLIRAYCEQCDEELTKTGRALYTSPLLYEYSCYNKGCCKYGVVLTKSKCYPMVTFIDKNGFDVIDES